MTYRQAQSLGAQVRRGEKATHIVFAKTAKKRETDEYGDETEVLLPVRRVYAVFNADQIDDVTAKYVPEVPDVTRSPPRNTARPPRRKRAFLPEPRTPRSTPRAPSCIMRFGSCPGHPAGTVRRTASIEASPVRSTNRPARMARSALRCTPLQRHSELFQCPRNAPSKIV